MTNNKISELLEKASSYQKTGDTVNAEAIYKRILELVPNHSVAFNNLGAIAFQGRRHILAMQYFEDALRSEPNNSAFILNLANTLFMLGHWEKLLHILDTKANVLGKTGIDFKKNVFGKKSGQKLFCVGFNKTGTTSLELALSNLGFSMGNQPRGELLLSDWKSRDFERITQLVTTADAFQDIPFSLPYTFQVMDMNFPNAKFILTIRDNPKQWYQSITTFHSKIVNGGKHIPTVEELKKFPYRYQGFIWDALEGAYNATTESPYMENSYIDCYNRHNTSVIDYFKYRPEKLLVLNVSESDAMQKLCKFLEIDWKDQLMPHSNKT